MDTAQKYREWGIPFVEIGSGKLVGRGHARRTIELIYRDGYDFLGYDAFTVINVGFRQPHADFGASFDSNKQPTLVATLESLKDDPIEISHYEFFFSLRA